VGVGISVGLGKAVGASVGVGSGVAVGSRVGVMVGGTLVPIGNTSLGIASIRTAPFVAVIRIMAIARLTTIKVATTTLIHLFEFFPFKSNLEIYY
jgi:hypothetical protein